MRPVELKMHGAPERLEFSPGFHTTLLFSHFTDNIGNMETSKTPICPRAPLTGSYGTLRNTQLTQLNSSTPVEMETHHGCLLYCYTVL